VDKNTPHSQNRPFFINKNPISINTSCHNHIHNHLTTHPISLDYTNHRNPNFPSNLHCSRATDRRHQQNRHPKPQRNAQRTRTNRYHLHPTTIPHRKNNNHLPKAITIFGVKYQTMLKTEGEGVHFIIKNIPQQLPQKANQKPSNQTQMHAWQTKAVVDPRHHTTIDLSPLFWISFFCLMLIQTSPSTIPPLVRRLKRVTFISNLKLP